MGAAYAGLDSDGIVAVLPVETLYRVSEHRPNQDTEQAPAADPGGRKDGYGIPGSPDS